MCVCVWHLQYAIKQVNTCLDFQTHTHIHTLITVSVCKPCTLRIQAASAELVIRCRQLAPTLPPPAHSCSHSHSAHARLPVGNLESLHSAPKNSNNNHNYCRGSFLSLISARLTYACKSKGNFEWFVQAIYHNTPTHTHTHTVSMIYQWMSAKRLLITLAVQAQWNYFTTHSKALICD